MLTSPRSVVRSTVQAVRRPPARSQDVISPTPSSSGPFSDPRLQPDPQLTCSRSSTGHCSAREHPFTRETIRAFPASGQALQHGLPLLLPQTSACSSLSPTRSSPPPSPHALPIHRTARGFPAHLNAPFPLPHIPQFPVRSGFTALRAAFHARLTAPLFLQHAHPLNHLPQFPRAPDLPRCAPLSTHVPLPLSPSNTLIHSPVSSRAPDSPRRARLFTHVPLVPLPLFPSNTLITSPFSALRIRRTAAFLARPPSPHSTSGRLRLFLADMLTSSMPLLCPC